MDREFVDMSLAVCRHHDANGLNKKARAGDLQNFTGIDFNYDSSGPARFGCLLWGSSNN
jgi:adenylylsulfate kinase-like enzyme